MLTRASRRIGTSFAAALLALFPRESRADDGRWLDLTWRAPSECPATAEIEKEITRLVGTSRREGTTVRAVVDVSGSDEQGWRAIVHTEYRGETGDRTLEGGSCRAVAKAAALVIALPVDSKAAQPEPPPPPPPPEPIVRPPVVSPPPSPRPRRWFVSVGPRSELGILQSPGFGLGVTLGARLPFGTLEAFGAGYLAESITVSGTSAGGRFTLLSAGLRLCPRVVHGAVELFACATVSFDRLRAQGFGITDPGSAATSLTTFALGPGVDFALTRAQRLTFGVDAGYTPGHASFILDNIGHVHTASRLGGTARLELAWCF